MPSLWIPLLLSAAGSFDWSAPDSCPSEADMRARVSGSTSKVQANVEPLESGFELTVNIDGQVRTLTTPSCEEAADTAVFLTELVGKKASPVRKVVAPALGSTREEQPYRPPPKALRARLHLGVLGGAEWLLLPRPVPRFGASLQVELEEVSLFFELRSAPSMRFGGVLPTDVAIDIAPSFDAQIGICRLFALGPLRAGPCAQAGLGAVFAVGVNVPIAHAKAVAVWTAGAALRASVQLGPVFELQAFASARLGPRPAYFFDGVPPLPEAPPPFIQTNMLGVDTGLGFGARW